MQIKDGNKPPENKQGITLVLFNTITELAASNAKNKQYTTFYIFF